MAKIISSSQEKYLKEFLTQKDPLLLKMEKLASEKRIPILSSDSVVFLEQLVMVLKAKRILEIGSAIAYSSIRIARMLGKNGMLYTVEKSKDNVKMASSFIKRSGYEDKIKLFIGDALDILPTFQMKFDLIFLDSDKEDYKKLFELSMILLKRGGVIFIDNLLWNGYTASNAVPEKYRKSAKIIREFNKLFMAHENLKASILPIGDGIGLGIKS